MECGEVQKQLSAYYEASLSFAEKTIIEEHLAPLPEMQPIPGGSEEGHRGRAGASRGRTPCLADPEGDGKSEIGACAQAADRRRCSFTPFRSSCLWRLQG